MKDIPVLFNDTDILIINKPFGLAVQGGEGVTVTVIDIFERQTGSKIYPIHRLDKDTAGILVLARSASAASTYSKYITEGAFEKEYRAVCFGEPQKKSGIIEIPAGRSGNEKPARSSWVLASKGNGYSYVSVGLETGRMHQIRIHLASIGCPIIADDKYGDFRLNRQIRSEFGVRKLQLCAYSLTLPVNGKSMRFSIALPGHMTECLEVLGIPHST